MTSSLQYNPLAIFEQNPDKGGVCTIKNFRTAVVAAAVDTALVALITGKRIRLLTLNVSADTATSAFDINTKPAGAGTAIFKDWAIYQVRNFWNVPYVGLIDSALSEGLSCTNGGGGNIVVSGRYIEIVP